MATVLTHMMRPYCELRMHVLNAVGWKYRTQKLRKKSPSAHHRTSLSSYIFVTKANSNISSIRPHNMVNVAPLMAEIGSGIWVTQQISTGFALGFVTAPTSLSWGQPNFARCLAIFAAGTLYIYTHTFWGSCRLTEFCQVQNSLCIQVLPSIFSALLHGTRGVGVSQTEAWYK